MNSVLSRFISTERLGSIVRVTELKTVSAIDSAVLVETAIRVLKEGGNTEGAGC